MGGEAGTIAGQRKITATITAIDPKVPSITFSGPNNWTYSSRVQDRKALSQDVAFGELRDKSGSQFHPASVEALIRAIEKRGEHYGDGYEVDVEEFAVAPPVVGVGSAGLGDLLLEDSAASA